MVICPQVNVVCGDVLDTMLHLAARYNIKDSVRQLVQHGAELVEAVNEQGDTALCLALKKGTRQVADELIECGALVNTQDALGRTPLHYCCLLTSAVETVTNLLRHGAVTDVKDWEGNTPLHLAAKVGYLLYSRGRSPPLKNGFIVFLFTNGVDTATCPFLKALLKCDIWG